MVRSGRNCGTSQKRKLQSIDLAARLADRCIDHCGLARSFFFGPSKKNERTDWGWGGVEAVTLFP